MSASKTNGITKVGYDRAHEPGSGTSDEISAVIDIEADEYTINALTVRRRDQAELLANLPPVERASALSRWIDFGFAVDRRVSVISEADYFEKQIQSVLTNFNTCLEDLRRDLDPSVEASLTHPLVEHATDSKRVIADTQTQLAELLRLNFDPHDARSAVAKIAVLHQNLQGQLDIRFDPKRKDSVFGRVDERLDAFAKRLGGPEGPFQAITTQLEALRFELGRQAALRAGRNEIIETTTAKGIVFEDELEARLVSVARVYGDIIDRKATKPGPGGSKKGDFVVELARGAGRIVIEAKGGIIRSTPELIKELVGAVSTRSADLAIAVVRNEDDLPSQIKPFQFYDEGIVVSFKLFEFAYRVARWIVVVQNERVPDGVDGVAAQEAIADIKTALKHLRPTRAEVRAIEKAAAAIRAHLSDIEKEILSAVTSLEACMDLEDE